jgi:hypothetical protein
MNEKPEGVIKIWLPRCPGCQGSDLQHYGTRSGNMCQKNRYYRCQECGAKFKGRIMNPDDDIDEVPFDFSPPWRK